MTYLKSVSASSALLDVLRAYPRTAAPLLELHEEIMRAASPLSPGERELIAAYVSALNGCGYCHGAHAAAATSFGVDPDLLGAVVADLDSAPLGQPMIVLLGYLRKVTLTPSRMTAQDADAVFAAGWDDQALHDAVLTCALFNFMNRMVDGLGVRATPDYLQMSGRRLRDQGYSGLINLGVSSCSRPAHGRDSSIRPHSGLAS
jgi:uncharacterized peroxidase-related enzyme